MVAAIAVTAPLLVGLLLDKITPVTAAALVSAGLLSVIAFPPVALLRNGFVRREPVWEDRSRQPG